MKVTRKMADFGNAIMPEHEKDHEIAPSLRLGDLPKEIEGLEPGKDFEAHVKGRCVGYECRPSHGEKEGNKHHYELEIHHFDHNAEGKHPKQKKSTREQTDDAMDKYDRDKEYEAKEKKEKEDKGKEKEHAKD
jgi:hypothetical protein